MAGYTGGGGGGAAVVPATFVVASDREDYPLTQAGLAAAIADLPAGGGTIYVGEGTLAITAPIVLSKDVKIIGAGIGCTFFSVAGAISAFTVGDTELTMSDFSVVGTDTAGQAFITLTASTAAGKMTTIERIRIGTTTGFGPDGTKIFIDAATFTRVWHLNDIVLFIVSGGSFLANGPAGGTMKIANVVGGGLFGGTVQVDAVNFTLTSSGNFAFGNQSKFANCRLNTSGTCAFGTETLVSNTFLICDVITFGITGSVLGGLIQCTTTTLGASCELTGVSSIIGALSVGASCVITACASTGAITATGAKAKVIGCTFTTFTCATAGADEHVLTGNTFTGAGNNVTLTDCDGCVVKGNIDCQVIEAASSDSNRYANISATSTIIGASSVIEDAQKFLWTSPDTLTTTDNAFFARIPVQVTTPVRLLSIEVETAPTGADVLVTFRKGTRSTGALAAAFATLTLPAGSFTASTTVAGITIAPTEFLVVNITQVGSTIAGSSATIVARG